MRREHEDYLPKVEHIRARLLVDTAIYLYKQQREAEIPLFKNTYKIAVEEAPLSDALSFIGLPRQFLHQFGNIGDADLHSQIEEILLTKTPGITYETNMFGSKAHMRHSLFPSSIQEGLYVSVQEATDYSVGVHAIKQSLVVAQRDLSVPSEYNMFLAKLASANGHSK